MSNLKTNILILLLLFAQLCKANMSSPVWEGTQVSTAFSSKDIRILSERIHIKIDKAFSTAKFIVEYTIQSDVSGKQIPLLFYAQDYKDSFLVWVDDQRIDIQKIPEKYTRIGDSPFSSFSGSFEKSYHANGTDEVTIHWSENSAFVYKINDLKYFETDIAKGTHKVRVEYTALAWVNVWGWVKEYSFRYSLTPAKFWKSFGTLNIQVEQEGDVKELGTNLGRPVEQKFATINNWMFTKLPAEYFEFSYSPDINLVAKMLIFITPLGIAVIIGVCLFIWHLILVRRYRRKFVSKKYSPVVIVGSLIVPFLGILSYIFAYPVIDSIIGDAAGRHHGYIFLVMMLYPILLPIYWVVLWLFDKQVLDGTNNNA
jgi:hypothetical protein